METNVMINVEVRGHSIWKKSAHDTVSVGHQKHLQKPEMEVWLVDTEIEACLQRQKPDTQQKVNKVRNVILTQTDFWKNLDLYCQIFESVL